ncbi:hypothetical protein [Robertkochia flava]|uniref:hypothetical protein n=1 Tax=Robertkochia flava TaxID=3447986 RepID=UPI001CCB74B2|nr:hypothetical protein [Robertkochia marina]
MNLLNQSKRLLLLCTAVSIFFSCTKTEENPGEDAQCELYLIGLSYGCVDNTCNYTATLENNAGSGEFDMTINEATYNHYKAITEQKEANICWEGEIE